MTLPPEPHRWPRRWQEATARIADSAWLADDNTHNPPPWPEMVTRYLDPAIKTVAAHAAAGRPFRALTTDPPPNTP